MEEKKPIKISLSIVIIIVLLAVAITALLTMFIVNNTKDKTEVKEEVKSQNEVTIKNETKKEKKKQKDDEIQYNYRSTSYCITYDEISFLGTTKNTLGDGKIIKNTSEYEELYDSIDDWATERKKVYTKDVTDEKVKETFEKEVEEKADDIKDVFDKDDYSEEFFEENNLVVVEYSFFKQTIYDIHISELKEKNNGLQIEIGAQVYNQGDGETWLFLIKVPKDSMENIYGVNVTAETTVLKNRHLETITLKPIIYLYPEKETDVLVKLLEKEMITCSYPKYTDGWKVLAKPNGDLVDKETGRNLYSLYYENDNKIDYKVEEDGFVVKGENSASFLEEKLKVLGLTDKEAEEFIIYWLPKLEENEYNYIRFATEEEINKNMPLEITPSPDTTIRVIMTYKKLDEPIKVKEQKLETPERKGFVVVEWGGSEIK